MLYILFIEQMPWSGENVIGVPLSPNPRSAIVSSKAYSSPATLKFYNRSNVTIFQNYGFQSGCHVGNQRRSHTLFILEMNNTKHFPYFVFWFALLFTHHHYPYIIQFMIAESAISIQMLLYLYRHTFEQNLPQWYTFIII